MTATYKRKGPPPGEGATPTPTKRKAVGVGVAPDALRVNPPAPWAVEGCGCMRNDKRLRVERLLRLYRRHAGGWRGYSTASQATLARRLGVSRRTIRRLTTTLSEASAVTVTRRGKMLSNQVEVMGQFQAKVMGQLSPERTLTLSGGHAKQCNGVVVSNNRSAPCGARWGGRMPPRPIGNAIRAAESAAKGRVEATRAAGGTSRAIAATWERACRAAFPDAPLRVLVTGKDLKQAKGLLAEYGTTALGLVEWGVTQWAVLRGLGAWWARGLSPTPTWAEFYRYREAIAAHMGAARLPVDPVQAGYEAEYERSNERRICALLLRDPTLTPEHRAEVERRAAGCGMTPAVSKAIGW